MKQTLIKYNITEINLFIICVYLNAKYIKYKMKNILNTKHIYYTQNKY